MEPALFIDAASPVISVGLQPAADVAPVWRQARDEAGVALFEAVAAITTVVFCEGPGSLLGVRLTAMALRTWSALPRAKPLRVFGYRSLELAAASLLARGVSGPFLVIADGRRSTWNALSVDAAGNFGGIRRRAATEPFAPGEAIFHPSDFPLWQTLPGGAQTVAYNPTELPNLAARFSLVRPVATPDAFMTEMPTYREWTPEHPVRPT